MKTPLSILAIVLSAIAIVVSVISMVTTRDVVLRSELTAAAKTLNDKVNEVDQFRGKMDVMMIGDLAKCVRDISHIKAAIGMPEDTDEEK